MEALPFTRRRFLAGAAAGGLAVMLPAGLRSAVLGARAAAGSDPQMYFLTDAELAACCTAICSRVVPSADPVTGAYAPGANEAQAVVFIDRLLSAFSLPSTVADQLPAVYLRGPYSNRNPEPDYSTGTPSSTHPPDYFMSPDGQGHYVDLDDLQILSWRALIEGVDAALASAPAWVSGAWVAQVKSGLIPGPGPDNGLQAVYRAGLKAFDSYSKSLFGVPFASASTEEQDLMLEAAGNAVASQFPLPSPPGAPDDAKTLFPYVVQHTFEGCYGLPEYRGLDSNPLWQEIRWDGDTQPLGSSIYDENAYGPGQGPNEGFGEPGIYQPRGDYREYRPVSTVGPQPGPVLHPDDLKPVLEAFEKLGVLRPLWSAR